MVVEITEFEFCHRRNTVIRAPASLPLFTRNFSNQLIDSVTCFLSIAHRITEYPQEPRLYSFLQIAIQFQRDIHKKQKPHLGRDFTQPDHTTSAVQQWRRNIYPPHERRIFFQNPKLTTHTTRQCTAFTMRTNIRAIPALYFSAYPSTRSRAVLRNHLSTRLVDLSTPKDSLLPRTWCWLYADKTTSSWTVEAQLFIFKFYQQPVDAKPLYKPASDTLSHCAQITPQLYSHIDYN